MPIPEAQLETWSHQGSIAQSSATYNTIRNVLCAAGTPYAGRAFEVFLQGSYGNATNIYAESDVDIVIRLDDTFHSDLEQLTAEEQTAQQAAFEDATYTHTDFKRDVMSVLTRQCGDAATEGDKAIKIEANGSRRKADVIVATQFRRYCSFRSAADSTYTEGICFFNAAGERIPNYPKLHAAHLTAKHQSTANRLKPLARVFKNMRSLMVDGGLIEHGTAPSYYLEGLLYNLPDRLFASRFEDSVVNVLNWYLQEAVKDELLCANEQFYLLRAGHHTCWSPTDCNAFIAAAVQLWNEWQ
jgi:hypothetical protein